MPPLREYNQKALDMGVHMMFSHWCSNHNGSVKAGHIDKIPVDKPGMIQFGPEVDLKNTVESFGRTNIVMGNKTHEECVQLTKQDIEKGKTPP